MLKNTIFFWQPIWNMISQVIFAGALAIFAGALPPWAPPWWRGRTAPCVALWRRMRCERRMMISTGVNAPACGGIRRWSRWRLMRCRRRRQGTGRRAVDTALVPRRTRATAAQPDTRLRSGSRRIAARSHTHIHRIVRRRRNNANKNYRRSQHSQECKSPRRHFLCLVALTFYFLTQNKWVFRTTHGRAFLCQVWWS